MYVQSDLRMLSFKVSQWPIVTIPDFIILGPGAAKEGVDAAAVLPELAPRLHPAAGPRQVGLHLHRQEGLRQMRLLRVSRALESNKFS